MRTALFGRRGVPITRGLLYMVLYLIIQLNYMYMLYKIISTEQS